MTGHVRFAALRFLALLLTAAITVIAVPAKAAVAVVVANTNYTLQVRTYRDIPFRTTVRQQYDYSCGSAALATLLRFHYGRDVGETEIFQAMYLAGDQPKIQKVGFSLLDMKRYLEQNGFAADGFRMSLDEFGRTATPAITIITIGPYRHFVVIKGVRNGRVLTGDPALGLRAYARADFEKIWSGIVFMIRGSADQKGSFNVDAEWDPWATAPSAERLDRQSLFGMNGALPPVYQVMQVLPRGVQQ